MSICAISVEPHRVRIATDTYCQTPNRHLFETSKIFPVAHAGVVLAGIGSTSMAQEAFHEVLRPGIEIDFDFLELRLQSVLDEIFATQMNRAQRFNCEASAAVLNDGNLIFLAGWSRAVGRMRARAFMQWANRSEFRSYEISGFSVTPRDPRADIDAPATDEEFVRMATDAIEYGQTIEPGGPFGGKLVVADLRRDSLNLSIQSLDRVTTHEVNQ